MALGVNAIDEVNIKKLKFLNIEHNNIGEEGYRTIAESQNFKRLLELQIYDGNTASAEVKSLIRRNRHLHSLRFIS